MDKAKRQSNIELLRIMTMCGVIVLHYNNATIGGGLAYAQGINLVYFTTLKVFLHVRLICLFLLVDILCTQSKRGH